MLVPDDLAQSIPVWAGERGTAWLAALPDLVAAHAERWGLVVGEPYVPSGYTSLALRVSRDGEPCVLKVRIPDEDCAGEATALRAWDGRAAVRLLADDGDALLLERCAPGTPLTGQPDDEVARVVAETLLALWAAPVPAGLPPLAVDRWAATISVSPAVAPRLRDEALDLLQGLRSGGRTVLLHRDLHGGNVLAATRRSWLAIDPKGGVGDAASDLAAVLRDRATAQAVPRRWAIVCDVTGLDPDRVRAWALVKCVEGAAWCRTVGDVAMEEEFAAAAALVAALGSRP